MAIHAIGKFKFKENKLEEVITELKRRMTVTISEQGCLEYYYMQDTEDPTQITSYEIWETMEDLERHSKVVQDSKNKVFFAYLDGPPEIHNYTKLAVEKSPRYHVETEIIINASPSKVWEVLTDFDTVHEWSSSFLRVEGEFKTGARVKSVYRGRHGRGEVTYDHHLIEVVHEKSFGWSDAFMAHMKDHHLFILEHHPDGTRFLQKDQVTGGHSRFLGHITMYSMKKSYNTFNKELKERVEQIHVK